MTRNEVSNVKENKSFLGTTIKFSSDSTFISDSSKLLHWQDTRLLV